MHLYVLKWDIIPEKLDSYERWAQFAIGKTVRAPGVQEFRAYRPVAGKSQVVVTYAFADFDSWEAWFNSQVTQEIFEQLFSLASHVERELWEPSPIAPDPIMPGSE